MQIDIQMRPSHAIAKLELCTGEQWVAEAGAMVAMSSGLRLSTKAYGHNRGVMKGLSRLLVGQSFFLNHYQAESTSSLWLAPKLPGDIMAFDLQERELVVQSGALLGAGSEVQIGIGWQGFKSLLVREGLLWVTLQGSGQVLLAGFGALQCIDVTEGFIVDSRHVLAFENTLQLQVSRPSKSWAKTLLSGEGLVCEFQGEGQLWLQSHSAAAFGRLLQPLLKPR